MSEIDINVRAFRQVLADTKKLASNAANYGRSQTYQKLDFQTIAKNMETLDEILVKVSQESSN